MHSVAEILLAMADPKPPGRMPGSTGDEPSVSAKRLRILIVEDDTIIACSLEALLCEIGHEVVDIASTGERALKAVAEFAPDLVMMDINLGSGMNGIEAAEIIGRRHSAKLIFVSAYGDPETREQVQQAVPGAPLLTKPVNMTLLARTLANIGGRTH